MKPKLWITGYFLIVISVLGMTGKWMYDVDPFFHYHKPNTERYYYALDNQRSQNDGISKHFDYDALITGTSMTENFKTSEMDTVFGTHSVKVSYSGGTYKEINDNLKIALAHNKELKMIVRGLDMGMFFRSSDAMRDDLGEFPTYLYDSNPINDVHYLFNKSVVFERMYPMVRATDGDGVKSGITSFDAYSNWQSEYTFGIHTVCPDGITVSMPDDPLHLTDEEKEVIRDNVRKNVTSLANDYQNVTFYYFITPYSAVWWKELYENGGIYRQIEAERYIIELILECGNIKLFSFNNRTDITTDMNNYKDSIHYGQWMNSLMLRWMHDGQYILTKDNYQDYLAEELSFYTSFDYGTLNEQEDYESDFYAAALLNQEISGAVPVELLSENEKSVLCGMTGFMGQYHGTRGIRCIGKLKRESGSKTDVSDYLMHAEYIGAKVKVTQADPYRYLAFYGKKDTAHGQPSVYVYDAQNEKIAELVRHYTEIDNEWHLYMIDLSDIKGDITIIFNGGYIDDTGDETSSYTFSGIWLY